MKPQLTLLPGEVHIWHASLQQDAIREATYFALLSEDEQQRALRFRYAKHKHYFVIARGLLRELLGVYLGLDPKSLQLAYHERGKPYLLGSHIEFNLSHSHDYAVFAFTNHTPIGIDIEKEEPTYEEAVARRYFSSEEYAGLQALPSELRPPAFYRIWARKEALIKAIGSGLSFSLSSFSVSLQEPWCETHYHFAGQAHWYIASLFIYPGFQAAFATPQPVQAVTIRSCKDFLVK